MFVNIVIVIHIIIIINKVLDWYQQQIVFRKGKGKGKDDYEQVLIIILFIISLLLS